MKKKLLAIVCFAATICSSLSIVMGFIYVSVAEKIESNIVAYYGNVNRSIELYDEALSQFVTKMSTHDGEEKVVYSDSFGGIYIDEDGLLNIGIVADDSYVRSLQTTSRHDGQVQYKRQLNSYNYLQTIKNVAVDIMTDYGIFMIEIDEMLNQVLVYVGDEKSVDKTIAYLRGMGLYAETAVNILFDPKTEVVPTATAYGGDKINNWLLTSGTICVNVIDNDTGEFGVLTNDHVAGTNMMYLGGAGALGSTIGIATKSQRSGTIDAAFIPFNNQNNWDTTTHAKSGSTTYTNIRLGAEDLIIQGAPVRKLGQTSGDTTGTITNRNATINIDYGSGIVQIRNTIRYSNTSLAGDSGGPVYFDDGGQNLFLIGMNFAGPIDPNTATFGIGCRITNVMSRLNITPITNGGIYNTTDLPNNEIRIDGVNYIKPSGVVVIPENLNGRSVVEIGSSAFANQIGLTNITIPNTVTAIGDSAFSGCSSLTSITIPSSVTTIDIGAFQGCSSLASITLPFAGYSLNGLNNTHFGYIFGALFSSGQNSFIPSSLKSVVITGGNKIGDNAFDGCSNLTNITLPNSLTSIGSSAFKGCTSLTTLGEIPEGITEINALMFENCTSLTSFNVDSLNAKYISDNGVIYTKNGNNVGLLLVAYPSGKAVTSFTVHANATEISAYAFNNANELMSVNLNKVKVVRKGNFNDCANLSAVTGNSVEYVESDTFEGTAFIQNFESDINSNYLSLGKVLLLYKGEETDIYVTGVYSIRDGAFANNGDLETVTFGKEIVNIGSYMFLGCTNLETVIFEASSRMVSCGDEPFDNNPNLKIIVPYCVLQNYQADEFWSNYINNFEVPVPKTLVTFNSDGGSSITSRNFIYGELIDFSNNNLKPTRGGFTFIGWKDEIGEYLYTYPSAILWKSLDSTITLKAVWVSSFEIETYTISFLSYEDGTEWIIHQYSGVAKGTQINSAPVNKPVRDGFTFIGWYTSPNGTGDAFSKFIVLDDTDFYALWQVTVTFDSALGIAVPTQYINYLDILMLPLVIELPSTSKGGYKASSWLCEGIEYDFGAPFTVTRSIHFTVQWTEKTLAECWNGSLYEIWTYNQFNAIRTNNGHTFKLMDTILLSGTWTPIPTFYGTLNGNNQYVYNLKISTTAPSGGYFGLIAENYGTVKNLNMWNTLINITVQTGSISVYAGAIAGRNFGTIDNCQSTGNNYYNDYYINCEKNNSYIGGIAGLNNSSGYSYPGVIKNCKNYLPVRGSGNMGGIVGTNSSTVSACTNNNVVQYTAHSINSLGDNKYIGGITGSQSGGSITGCTNNSGVYYMNAKNTTSTVLQPCMGQIIGYKSSGTTGSNTLNGNMEISNLVKVGSFNQALYAGNRECGRS